MSYTLWDIWLHRNHNNFNHDKKHLTFNQITRHALEFTYLTTRYTKPKLLHPIKWIPPTPNYYKLNTDGVVITPTHQAGIGGVIRDSHGNWIVGFAGNSDHANILQTELQALFQELELAKAYCLTPLEINADATEVIKILQHDHPLYTNLIYDCRHLLDQLLNPTITHIYREENTMADELAKAGCNMDSTSTPTIFEMTPHFVNAFLRTDQAGDTFLWRSMHTPQMQWDNQQHLPSLNRTPVLDGSTSTRGNDSCINMALLTSNLDASASPPL